MNVFKILKVNGYYLETDIDKYSDGYKKMYGVCRTFFVYFNYGLDPLNRYNVMEKTLVADEAGLSMLIDEKYGLKNNVVRLSWDDVAGREVQAGCVVIYVHKYRGNRFVAVPLSAFPSEQVLRDFVTLFDAMV